MNNLFRILANTADGAFVIDEDHNIIYWNEAAQEILGYTSDEVVGQPCYDILGGQDDKGRVICRYHCSVVTTALKGDVVTDYDTCIHTKSGEVRWINVSILNVPASNNDTPPLIVHLFRDATQKKKNEKFISQILNATEHLLEIAGPTILPMADESVTKELTDREREILSLLAQGSGTDHIAQSLSISSYTVRNHVQNILHKLQVHSRLEAVAYALEHGLVDRD
jgi:PAS domain S-box-containing protein